MEDGRIFNLSITFSQIFIFRIESPFSISFQNFAGHRRIRFFHGKRIEMDWFRRYVAGFRLRSSTISKLEYIIGVSVEIESCRTKRNFPSPANQMRKQVASEASIPDFRQPLAPSRRNCYPNRDHRSSGYNVKNWWKIRSMIGKYDPILLSQPVRISENCAEDEKSSSFSPRVAPYVPKKKKKKNMETPPNWQFIRAWKLINWNYQTVSN